MTEYPLITDDRLLAVQLVCGVVLIFFIILFSVLKGTLSSSENFLYVKDLALLR